MRPEITTRPAPRCTTRTAGLPEKEPQDGRGRCTACTPRSECMVGNALPTLRGNSERRKENNAAAMRDSLVRQLHEHRVADEADGEAFDLGRLAGLDDEGGGVRV